MRRALIFMAWALLAVVALRSPLEAADKEAGRVFEMRTYIANDGKLDSLNERFRKHTNRLFEKHGMTLIGYWTPTDGPEAKTTLVYILAFPSRAARDKSFEDFQNDPEWKEAKAASEKDGPLVKEVKSLFLAPTDYSAIK